MTDLATVPWRIGRKVGRTIYAVVGPDRDSDELIGVMDTRELAAEAVEAHNERVHPRMWPSETADADHEDEATKEGIVLYGGERWRLRPEGFRDDSELVPVYSLVPLSDTGQDEDDECEVCQGHLGITPVCTVTFTADDTGATTPVRMCRECLTAVFQAMGRQWNHGIEHANAAVNHMCDMLGIKFPADDAGQDDDQHAAELQRRYRWDDNDDQDDTGDNR